MRRIVVTGATSFIGVHLIEEWIKEPCEIFAVVRPNSNNLFRIKQNEKVHIVERSMQEYDRLAEDIPAADFFYHLSWEGARLPYRNDRLIQEKNYECTIKAFDSAVKMGCSLFLGAGSQAEYGLTKGLVTEDYPCCPDSEYGKEKLHACLVLSEKAKEKNIRFIWTRIFSLYGKYDYPKTLVMSAIDKMQRNEPLQLTHCTQLWDYLNVVDAARAMKLFALHNANDGIYNLASGNHKQLKEFVYEIKTVINSESELYFGAVDHGASVSVDLVPDINKIAAAINWQPAILFRDGILELVK